MAKLVECVPNYSEGKDQEKIDRIANEFRNKEGVTLLDVAPDANHNRTVVTVIGDPEKVKTCLLNSVKVAQEVIDMTTHHGGHPRMGAVDVVPFTPVSDITMDECVQLANEVGEAIGNMGIPVYLYEQAATKPERENLASVRKGEYEGFFDKIKEEGWEPDYGPREMNAKSGATAVGARVTLVAFNINLDTPDVSIAKKIANKVRNARGGLHYVKAIGLPVEERGLSQVSMNLVDFNKSRLYQAYEMVKMEARRYGVNVVGSEVVGTLPMKALIDSAEYYLQIENFDQKSQILEQRLLDAQSGEE